MFIKFIFYISEKSCRKFGEPLKLGKFIYKVPTRVDNNAIFK